MGRTAEEMLATPWAISAQKVLEDAATSGVGFYTAGERRFFPVCVSWSGSPSDKPVMGDKFMFYLQAEQQGRWFTRACEITENQPLNEVQAELDKERLLFVADLALARESHLVA